MLGAHTPGESFVPRITAFLLILILGFPGCVLDPAATPDPTTDSPGANVDPAGERDEPLAGSVGPVDQQTEIGVITVAPLVASSGGIRIATFNVEFLFDGIEPEGEADFGWKGDPEAARHHRNGVAAIIRQLNADIVVLQEVENEEVMRMMLDESLSDLRYEAFYVRGRDTFTRQDVGILSRLPVDEIGRTDERAPLAGARTDYGVSKNLWARLDLGGIPTTIIGVHLLARPSDSRRTAQREAQAEVIASLASREMASGREVIVLGDFNDYDDEVLDRAGSIPIARTLAIIKGAGGGLTNAINNVPRQDRFTILWDRNRNHEIEEGELTAIDHILLSARLQSRLVNTEYVHSHDPRKGPDHFPVVVTLNL